MKEIINGLTGEVIEIPEDNKLELKKEMDLIITEDILDKYYQVQALQEQIEVWKFQKKEQITKLFKKYGIKSYKNDYMTITLKEDSVQKRVDTEKLKEAGIYNMFIKEVPVKGSLAIKIHDNNE